MNTPFDDILAYIGHVGFYTRSTGHFIKKPCEHSNSHISGLVLKIGRNNDYLDAACKYNLYHGNVVLMFVIDL